MNHELTFRDSVVTITTPRRAAGRIVGVRFAAHCERCGATGGGDWTTAGMAASWSAAHRGVDPCAPLDDVCEPLRDLIEIERGLATAAA